MFKYFKGRKSPHAEFHSKSKRLSAFMTSRFLNTRKEIKKLLQHKLSDAWIYLAHNQRDQLSNFHNFRQTYKIGLQTKILQLVHITLLLTENLVKKHWACNCKCESRNKSCANFQLFSFSKIKSLIKVMMC